METLDIHRRGDGTAVVTIHRPDKLNAMNHAFFAELPQVMSALDDDPDVRACVLTGADKAFSAGGDIEDFHSLQGTADYRRQVKMAVNGIAFGGGTEITLACDIAFASERARFSFKEITLGLMRRDRQRSRRGTQPGAVGAALRLVGDPHERRVPVPAPAPVVAEAHVLAQPVEAAGTRPVRVVRGDRVGDVLQGREAVEVRGHEVADPLDAGGFDVDDDVDEDERAARPGRSPATTSDVMPPSDAPTSTGGRSSVPMTATRSAANASSE